MVYDTKHDMIQAKQLSFSNGKKRRGELQSKQEELIIVKTSDEDAKEKIKNLLTILPKTLRTMLSITNSFYDLTGFIMPLHNQLRATTIDILIDGRTYDEELDDKTWKHFVTCLIELIKANNHKYKRRPDEESLKEDGKKILITYCDYSMAWVSLTYLLEEKRDDTFAV